MDTARSLKVVILTLIGCVAIALALDDTIKGLLAMDILLVAAYIAAIATAWVVYDEDGRIGSLPVAAMIIAAVFGVERFVDTTRSGQIQYDVSCGSGMCAITAHHLN